MFRALRGLGGDGILGSGLGLGLCGELCPHLGDDSYRKKKGEKMRREEKERKEKRKGVVRQKQEWEKQK